jgi:hypothetical protein
MIRSLLLAGLLAWSSLSQANLLQHGYEARYAVSRDGLPLGQSVRVLRPLDATHWSFEAHATPTGLAAVLFGDVIDEYSQLQLQDGLIVPLQYSYSQHGGRKDKAYALRFDWAAGRIEFTHSGEQLPLPPGTQDPLSFVVAVMQKLMRGEQDFQLTIAGSNKLRDYRVRATEQVDMNTVLGRQAVVRVEAEEIGKDTRYDLWCLRNRDYLPLRIRQVRKQQTTDLRLRELVTPPPPATAQP